MVGWPVLQASISILLGILPLATTNLYIVQVCFKTVTLIIVIGKLSFSLKSQKNRKIHFRTFYKQKLFEIPKKGSMKYLSSYNHFGNQ